MNAAGDHTMGSTIPREVAGASTKTRSLLAANAAVPGTAGFDVSAWQPNSGIDWGGQYNAGARFVYIKATESTTYQSSQFASQYNSSAAAGYVRGAYHFAVPNKSSGATQANYFVDHGGGWTPDGHTLPPLLDIEYNPYSGSDGTNSCYGLSQAAMSSWISDFSNTVHARVGTWPAIYTTTDWWRTCTGNSNAFPGNALFIARYPASLSSGAGTLPASWVRYALWQYSSTGPWPGDSDTFNGSVDQLVQFANTGTPSPPLGSLDSVTTGLETVTVSGWAMDALSSASTQVHVYIDGAGYVVNADQNRADVAAAYPTRGAAHGFQKTFSVSGGQHQVCVYAIGVNTNLNTPLGCRTVSVTNASPVGSVDTAQAVPGGVAMNGWALDPETSDPINVDVYVDSTWKGSYTANANRADVGRAFPSNGSSHGFSTTVSAAPGSHTVCAYGINTGTTGSNALISCKQVNVPSAGGFGSFDNVVTGTSSNGGAIGVFGWAIDGSSTGSSFTDVYVDGRGTRLTADQSRSDVGSVYPGYGSAHGFSSTISAAPGDHSVCAYAISPKGGNTLLGCRTVNVPNSVPVGSLDAATGVRGGVAVSGWVIDPDSTSSTQAHVYVDGVGTALQADQTRTDVGKAWPGYGAAHGYSATVPASSGSHTVCVYGIDTAGGQNPTIGCRAVTVP